MADVVTQYTLATPGGTIIFNNGTLRSLDDLYWTAKVRGLDSPRLRTNEDDAPQTHGSIIHNTFKGSRYPAFEGDILIQSVPLGSACQAASNVMETALKTALESILAPVDGTLSWTPLGESAKSLSVNYWVGLEVDPVNNYATRYFTFGLIAGSPDY